MSAPTWYDVLGLERGASPDQVRAAWRSSIADLDPGDRRFRSLNEAAEVLLDRDRRAAYDAALPPEELEEPEEPQEPAPEPEEQVRPAGSGASVLTSAPASPEQGDEAAPSRRGRLLTSSLVLVLAAVVAAVLVTVAAIAWTRPFVDESQVRRAESAAEQAIVPVLSYDYRHLDEDARTARGYLTSGYQGDYDQLFSVIEQNAPETKTVVRTEVVASSIVRTAPGRVDVLMFVNRPTTNKQQTDPVVYRDQVTVSMVLTSGEWLVDDLSTTPPPA